MIGAAGLVTSMAQVYSVNIVGYVNTTVPVGFSIIQNPLTASPDNTVASVIPSVPAGAALTIYKFNSASGSYLQVNWDSGFGEWDDPTLTIAPGEGFFAYNGSAAAYTLTFVGEVPTGTLTTPLVVGFNMVGSKVPQAGLVQTDLGYTPSSAGESIYKYNNATGSYLQYNYDAGFGEWDEEPSFGVGEAFFTFRGGPGDWTRTFNVN
jgi:hypothetical protein